MQIKKALIAGGLFLFIMLFSGCGENKSVPDKPKEEDTSLENAGYIGGMLQINKKAHENINNATEKENSRLNNALDGVNSK